MHYFFLVLVTSCFLFVMILCYSAALSDLLVICFSFLRMLGTLVWLVDF